MQWNPQLGIQCYVYVRKCNPHLGKQCYVQNVQWNPQLYIIQYYVQNVQWNPQLGICNSMYTVEPQPPAIYIYSII